MPLLKVVECLFLENVAHGLVFVIGLDHSLDYPRFVLHVLVLRGDVVDNYRGQSAKQIFCNQLFVTKHVKAIAKQTEDITLIHKMLDVPG